MDLRKFKVIMSISLKAKRTNKDTKELFMLKQRSEKEVFVSLKIKIKFYETYQVRYGMFAS